jgi:WD40 repeat protein
VTASGKELRRLGGFHTQISSIAFSPDGKTLASIAFWQACIWDAASGKKLREIRLKEPSNAVAISPDGRLLAAGWEEKTLGLWSTATGKMVRELTGQEAPGWSLAFSPDGKTLASAGRDPDICLWDVATGKKAGQLKHGQVNQLAFSPDGKTLVSAGNITIRFWDVTARKELRRVELKGDDARVGPVAFSPDGKTVAVANDRGEVGIWDAATAKGLYTLTGQVGLVLTVAFSPDGRTIASGGLDQTICL